MTGLYIIWDRAAEARFGGIMLTNGDTPAIRAFEDIADDTDRRNIIRNHPEDFDLRYIGELADNGTLIPYTDDDGKPEVRLVYSGSDWMKTHPPTPPELQRDAFIEAGLRQAMHASLAGSVSGNGQKRPWWRLGGK